MPIVIAQRDALDYLKAQAQRLLELKNQIVFAIDGMAASGKTTLAGALQSVVPEAYIVHMDDFFLPPEKRNDAYLQRTLAFADIERFHDEVLLPLARPEAFSYRPYAFHPVPGFLPPVTLPEHRKLVIVEGAYCLHPDLFDAYDLCIMLTIASEAQQARILRRNGEAMLARFQSEWIPRENRHIAARGLRERCDVVIEAT